MAYDPFQITNPFSAPDQAARQPAAPTLPPLSPAEESSLLSKIGSAGLGGLSWLGGIINKPGRIVRGVLGGHLDELGNAIPFSDALGITNPEREVRGTDLIGADKDTPFFSAQGLAGFGVDIATDPLTYLSFGGSALSKAGVAAKKAGTLPSTVAERAAQGLGGHVGVGLPFSGNAATFDLAPAAQALKSAVKSVPGGSTALDAASAVGERLGAFYTATVPPLFQGSVMGRKTAVGQQVARAITEGTPEAIAKANEVAMPLAKLAQESGLADQAGATALRTAGETGVGVTPEMAAILDPASAALNASNAKQIGLGLPASTLSQQEIRAGVGEGSQLGYLPREKTAVDPTVKDFLRTKSPALAPEYARKEWTAGLTTESLNKMATEDMAIPGSTLNPIQQYQQVIGEKYLNVPKQQAEVDRLTDLVHTDMAAHQGIVTDTASAEALKQAEAVKVTLENQAAELAKIKAAGALPQFLNHPVRDVASKLAKDNVNMLKATEIYKGAASAVVPAGHDTVPLMDFIGRLWKPTETAGESIMDAGGNLIGHTPPQGAQVAMQEALTKAGVTGKLADLHVPAALAEDLAGLTKMHSINGMQEFTKLWDSVTNLTKAGQTMFPGTVVRNVIQDFYNKMVYGMHDPSFSAIDPRRYTQPIQDWKALANSGTVEGLAQKLSKNGAFHGLDDAQAADKLREMYSAWDVGRQGFKSRAIADYGADLGTAAPRSLEGLLPISEQKGPVQAYLGGLKDGDLNPLGVSGAFGKTSDSFKPVKAMRSANNANDSMMRGSSFLAKLEQGFEPAQAFQEVMKAHYDFGNLSQFEKGFMRRAVPFYSWARQNIPAVIKEIGENPGGFQATSVKATAAMKGQNPGFIPSYIGEGVAAPIGGEENGQQRYLTHLGLGFEDIGSLAGPGGPLGMLNPLIKAPIEAATGKQLFTGRDLRDLHSRLGDVSGTPLPATENVLMNSPLGRTLSTAGTIADPRKSVLDKALNLLSGARLSDVDMEASRRSAVRDFISSNLHGPGVSHFESLSVKPENMPLLSPLEQQLYRLQRNLAGHHPLPPTDLGR